MYVCYDNDSILFEQSILYLDIQDIYYSTHVFHLEIQETSVLKPIPARPVEPGKPATGGKTGPEGV